MTDAGRTTPRGVTSRGRERRVDKVERNDRHLGWSWTENVFFVLVMLLAFAFAIILLQAVQRSWTIVLFLVFFWAVMAYLALPRLHRVLTSIYVPDYFIGRSRTTDGLLGDPINLALTGTQEQLHQALTDAGWVRADPVTFGSSWRIITSSVFGRSYPQAPVSPLMLFGRTQAFSYQQEVAGSPSKRHHIRFWPTPEGWLLPGGYRVDWLASGTFDTAVGLSLFTWQVTHRIDRNIDIERDYVVGTVLESSSDASVHLIKDFSTGYHSRNGGGDAVETDGDLPVLQLHDVEVPDVAAVLHPVDASPAMGGVGRRPLSIVSAFALTIVSTTLTIGDLAYRWLGLHLENGSDYLEDVPNTVAPHTVVGLVALGYVPIVWLAWRTYCGGRVSRLIMVAMVTATQMVQMGQYLNGNRATVSALLTMCTDLLLVYALTSLSAREWTTPSGADSAGAGVGGAGAADGTSGPGATHPSD